MRAQKQIKLSNGNSLVVWQANYDMSLDRDTIEQQAREERIKQNGSGDKAILFFQEVIFSGLSAFSTGDIPSLHDAFKLSPDDLDNWHLEIAQLNPGLYIVKEYRQKEIKIGDRSIIVLSNRPSVMMKRVALEVEAESKPATGNIKKDFFIVSQYPRMAGCSIGDVPTSQEALTDLTIEELDIWYTAAKEMLPAWFETQEEISEREVINQKEDKKKSVKRAVKS